MRKVLGLLAGAIALFTPTVAIANSAENSIRLAEKLPALYINSPGMGNGLRYFDYELNGRTNRLYMTRSQDNLIYYARINEWRTNLLVYSVADDKTVLLTVYEYATSGDRAGRLYGRLQVIGSSGRVVENGEQGLIQSDSMGSGLFNILKPTPLP